MFRTKKGARVFLYILLPLIIMAIIATEWYNLHYAFANDTLSGEGLTYWASNLPPGATFDPDTRTFSWIPEEGQAGVYPNVRFGVTDSRGLSDWEDITITVYEKGLAPLPLSPPSPPLLPEPPSNGGSNNPVATLLLTNILPLAVSTGIAIALLNLLLKGSMNWRTVAVVIGIGISAFFLLRVMINTLL